MEDFVTDILEASEEASTDESAASTTAEQTTEEQTDGTEETQTEDEQNTDDTAAKPTTAQQQTISVKFNHESREIPLDEATVLIQKGLAYDSENVAETRRWLDDMARLNGFDNGADYRKAVSAGIREQQIKRMAEEKGIPESVAKEIAERDEKIKLLEKEKNADIDAKAEKNKIFAEIDELRRAYPSLDLTKIPKEVYDLKAANPDVPMRFVYAEYEAQQLKNAEAVKQKHIENKASSTPSLKGKTTPSTTTEDELLKSIFN